MNNIGQRIRELRKKNDLTQEKLANFLNVSFQTVSKWEVGTNTPDLSFLVPLAKLLHTTTDALLGYEPLPEEDDSRRKELEAAWEAERYGMQDGIKMMDAARALTDAYPENLVYWCWLAYAESLRVMELAREQKMDEYAAILEQSLKHYEMVIEDCEDDYWREEALESAVRILCIQRRMDQALEYANQLPEGIRRDRVYRECLPPEERIRHIQDMRSKTMHKFLNELLELTHTYLWAAEMMLDIIRNMIADGNYLIYHNYLDIAYRSCANHYLKAERYDDTMKALTAAWFHAKEYDKFNAVQAEHPFTAPLMDRLTTKSWLSKHSSAETFRSTLDIFRTTAIGEREEFRAIEAEWQMLCTDSAE